MRVLFVPLALASHYYPLVPLAWAFHSGGHEVRVAAQPQVLDRVERSGLLGVSVGGGYDLMAALERSEAELQRLAGRRLADFADMSAIPDDLRNEFIAARHAAHLTAARVMAEDLLPYASAWRPDLVVTDLATVAGPLVAGVLGLPLVQQSWGPQYPAVARQPGFGGPIDQWPAALRDLFDRFGAERRAVFSVCTVDPCPPTLQRLRVPNQWVARYVPYNGPGRVPGWSVRNGGRPRVCVSWGISNVGMLGMGDHPVTTVVRALSGLDVDVVVTVRSDELATVPVLTDRVRVAEELPLQAVLPGCVAAVHHGGAGTLMTAVANGVPQVVLPQEPTGVFMGDLLAEAGAGIVLRGDDVRSDAIAEAVSRILTESSWSTAAARLRDENAAAPSPAETVAAVEGVVRAQ